MRGFFTKRIELQTAYITNIGEGRGVQQFVAFLAYSVIYQMENLFFAIAMRQVLSEGEAVAPNLLGATEWTWSLKRSAAPPPILGEGRIALIKKIKRRDGEIKKNAYPAINSGLFAFRMFC